MNFSRFHLTDLPDLSQFAVEDLDLSRNNIKEFDHSRLPRGIKRLHLEHNDLTQDGLPPMLPNTLEELYLAENDWLSSLRGIQVYPSSLKVLDLQGTEVETLAYFDCDSIEVLRLDRTPLKILQNLPKKLKYLSADRSSVRLLPNRMPSTLETLQICRSWINYAGLPRFWGTTLRTLSLEGNFIEKFPVHLPSTLQQINLSCNRLTEIPTELPEQLVVLNLSRNCIRKLPIVRRGKAIRIVYLWDNQLTSSPVDENEAIGRRWASDIEEQGNWNTERHRKAAQSIQKVWRRYRTRNRLRTWIRTARVKEELFQIAMMPERVWQTDTLSPEWKRTTTLFT